MDFLQKHFCGVFELSLLRNAKNVLKKAKVKAGRQVGLGFSTGTGGGVGVFLAGPSAPRLQGALKKKEKKSEVGAMVPFLEIF
jgi:hypothetical protein